MNLKKSWRRKRKTYSLFVNAVGTFIWIRTPCQPAVSVAEIAFCVSTEMNNTKIEWTDFTWNPISGCLRNCPWCYAKKIYHRFGRSFEPTFYHEKLKEPLRIKKPKKIFACSVADVFAIWTKESWRQAVFKIMRECPQHIFQILTQDPQNINKSGPLPENAWIGTTVRNPREVGRIEILKQARARTKFVSFEPLMSEIKAELCGIEWVIIGAMTGPMRNRYKPEKEWVDQLITNAKTHSIPIFLKDNLSWKPEQKKFPRH